MDLFLLPPSWRKVVQDIHQGHPSRTSVNSVSFRHSLPSLFSPQVSFVDRPVHDPDVPTGTVHSATMELPDVGVTAPEESFALPVVAAPRTFKMHTVRSRIVCRWCPIICSVTYLNILLRHDIQNISAATPDTKNVKKKAGTTMSRLVGVASGNA